MSAVPPLVKSTEKPFSFARAAKSGSDFSAMGQWLGSVEATTRTRNPGDGASANEA